MFSLILFIQLFNTAFLSQTLFEHSYIFFLQIWKNCLGILYMHVMYFDQIHSPFPTLQFLHNLSYQFPLPTSYVLLFSQPTEST